jgi:hypothetical protein
MHCRSGRDSLSVSTANRVISVGGGGGEGHRPFYIEPESDQFLEGFRNLFRRQDTFENIKSDVLKSIDLISANTGSASPMMLHYREFRDRLHSGLLSNYSTRVSPLASKYLHEATAFKTSDELVRNQVLFDAMNTLAPDLMRRPYDHPKKSPSVDCLAALLHPFKLDGECGRVYRLESDIECPAPDGDKRPIDYMAEALDCQQSNEAARKVMNEAVELGHFGHPRYAAKVHAALLEYSIHS